MKSIYTKTSAILVILLLTASSSNAHSLSKIKKEPLKVLYVGGSADINLRTDPKPTSEQVETSIAKRMNSFETLLREHFTHVEVIRAKEYDVTIMDGTPPLRAPLYTEKDDNGNITVYKNASFISEDFEGAMLTIAEASDRIGRRIGLKLDWYCLCLDAHAYNFDKSHPIFNGPFKVKITTEVLPTPEDALKFRKYYKKDIPATQTMWRVQKEGYMTTPDIRIGMVCRPWGFTDSPEAEVISGGVSLKSPDAIAIGRHGNFFHWGFAASPENMTQEAKSVFANAVVYASKHKHKKVIARKYDDRKTTRHEMFFVYSRAGKDSAQFAQDLPYLYVDRKTRVGLSVDQDAKAMGIPTYDKAILDKAIGNLEKDINVEQSQRILDRYTLATFSSPKEWRNWYENNNNQLFFSESGGFCFLINSIDREVYGNDYSLMQIERFAREMIMGETDNMNPVNTSAKLLRLLNGDIVAIAKFKIEPEYHIYDVVSSAEPYIATEVEFIAPNGYSQYKGVIRSKSSQYGQSGTTVFENEAIFYQLFTNNTLSNDSFICKVSYQCCDNQICMPPVEKGTIVTFPSTPMIRNK